MAIVEPPFRVVQVVADSPADDVRERLECLYRAHGDRVLAICSSVLRDPHEAEDAAQQVFVSAFQALLRGTEPRDPVAWLATIARNESWARARRQPSVPLEPALRDVTQRDPSSLVVERMELARVWSAIEALPASQRDALLLREVRGLGYDELAADLQLSHPSVRSLINRARRTLRNQVERGAAALAPAPWLNFFTRVFGDASTPALSSASRTAAVGLGVIAITGGAVVAPSLTSTVHKRPVAHVSARAAAQQSASSTRPASRTEPVGNGVPAPVRVALRRRLHDDHHSEAGRRIDRRRGRDGVPGGGKSGDSSSSSGGDSATPDSHDGPSASPDGGGRGSDGSSGSQSRSGATADGGRSTSGSSGSDGGGSVAVTTNDGLGSSGGSGSSDGRGAFSVTPASSSTTGESPAGSSDERGSGGGSSSGGSVSTSDGGGGGSSSGASGSDDGSGGSGSSSGGS
jgi:RNA polymerase sigma factor (sigma-70 family)